MPLTISLPSPEFRVPGSAFRVCRTQPPLISPRRHNTMPSSWVLAGLAPSTLTLSECRMTASDRKLLSGDEAVALAARDLGRRSWHRLPRHALDRNPRRVLASSAAAPSGRRTRRSPWRSRLGAAFAGARALVTMKHVGLNVAADPLFTAAYTGVDGRPGRRLRRRSRPGLQPERAGQPPLRGGRRRAHARALGFPGSLRLLAAAFELSERWHLPVLCRITTRVCHSKTDRPAAARPPPPAPARLRRATFPARVMIPAYARPAHRRLRTKLAEIAAWDEACRAQPAVVAGDTLARHHRLRHLLPARPRGRADAPASSSWA